MVNKIENWLLNVFAGKILARLAVTIIGFIASGPVQAILSQAGVNVQIDQTALTGSMVALAHAIFEWFKKRRAANPASPAVQTDPSAPGADKSAIATVAAAQG